MIVEKSIAERAFQEHVAYMGHYTRHPYPQNTTLFEERKQAFFAATWFPTLALPEGKYLHHMESLTDNARFFEKFFWTPHGLTLCAMVLDPTYRDAEDP